jgi:hypothetical protein
MKHLDRVPMGFSRARKGWLLADATPQAATIARLDKQNRELKSKLADIEEIVQLLLKDKEVNN